MSTFKDMAEDCNAIIAILNKRNYSCSNVDGMLDAIKYRWYWEKGNASDFSVTPDDIMEAEGHCLNKHTLEGCKCWK